MSSNSAPNPPSATDQSRAVSQLEEQNDRQDAEIEAINNSSGIDRFLASANPFSATGYIAQINRKIWIINNKQSNGCFQMSVKAYENLLGLVLMGLLATCQNPSKPAAKTCLHGS